MDFTIHRSLDACEKCARTSVQYWINPQKKKFNVETCYSASYQTAPLDPNNRAIVHTSSWFQIMHVYKRQPPQYKWQEITVLNNYGDRSNNKNSFNKSNTQWHKTWTQTISKLCNQQQKWDEKFEKSKHPGEGPYQNSSPLNPGSQPAFHKPSA